ncbi:MAG TPA: hypothetical protein DDW93_07225, partial [Firmicutes bacterium]|nr:hypothetical protein [Bacillota bacterium]
MIKKRIILILTAVILFLAVLPRLIIIVEAFKKEKAYQFMVNGEPWFIVSEKDSLERILVEYQ